MKAKAHKVSKLINEEGNTILQFYFEGMNKREAEALYSENKEYSEIAVEAKKYRNSRSVNANALLWKMCYEIGAVIKRSKEDVYLTMLERYGIFTHIIVKPNMVDKVKAEWKNVKELGEMEINGKPGVQLQCYFGSSTYNTKEFSVLLDGIIEEAKDLGIETIEEQEKQAILDKWEEKKE